MKKKKTIAVCSSVAFYKDVLVIAKQLQNLGYTARVPITAKRMSKNNNFDETKHKTWYKDPTMYKLKTKLMNDHFKKVVSSDAVLIVNNKKNNIPGYIGGNTLMEITLAFHYKKPIYILNQISENLSIKEEIYGVSPKFLKGDLKQIKL